MKLRGFFEAVGPYFLGAQPLDRTVAALGGVDGKGLALYGHFCDVHRAEILDGVYPVTKTLMAPGQWKAAFDAYFKENPTRHWELNANAAAFPEFLRQHSVAQGLPAWLWELADVEWWHFAVFVAADEKIRLRRKDQLHPSLVLRPYTHDVLAAHDSEGKRPPRPGPVVARFHRDKEHNTVAALASPAELVVIKAIVEGVTLASAARQSGLKPVALRQARSALIKDGALVGARRA